MHKRFLCLGMSVLLAFTCFATPLTALAAKEESTKLNDNVQSIVDNNSGSKLGSYYDYNNEYASTEKYLGFVEVDATKFTKADNAKTGKYEGIEAVVLDSTNTWVEYKINIPEDGRYGIALDYYQLPNKEKDIEITVSVDGKIPYTEAKQVTIPRIWEDNIDTDAVPEGSYFECDDPTGMGDDKRPSQKEKQIWTTRDLINLRGLYNEPYQFYLTKGTHTLRLTLDREAFAISKIKLGNKTSAKSYSDYIKQYSEKDYVKNGENGDLSITHQAEQTTYKNNIVLYPTYDKTNASTLPSNPAYTKLNTIGQSNWTTNGDEIVWNINSKKAGLYKLTFRARQNYNEGMTSYRTLRINGEIPFAEAETLNFKYDQGWYMMTIGDGTDDYYVYLNEGNNTVSLTCTTGAMAEVLREIQQSVLDLNEIYREIISVTSTEPDIYRDYDLDEQIPTLVDDLKEVKNDLDITFDKVYEITGTEGSQASSIVYVSKIIGELADDPYVIAERLSSLKNGIETLGGLVSTLSSLALEIDYMVFTPKDAEIPSGKVGFLKSTVFTWKQFISSFTVDYNMTGTTEGEDENTEPVKVWVSTGRDQAKIINELISDNSEKLVTSDGKKISVQLSMVDTGATLIRATLAGKGPDCALMIPADTPMNLAARGALVSLTDYKKNIEHEFYPSAFIPFYYNGEYYALPEKQVFDLLFYRTDVFEQYNLTPPKTWDEFYEVMEVLQNANLKVGILEINSANAGVSAGIVTFEKFLFQNGGTYYNDELSGTRFNEEVAYNAFEQWTELYTKYGLDRQYDFYSRFRTGEMPLAIQSYGSYNQVKAAAPELNGLWTIAQIPGTVQEDGSIDHSDSSVITGCIMLKSAQKKGIEEEASVFLKWWVSSETQSAFARELEATLGIAARYDPANINTFETIGWTADEAEVIKSQWKSVTALNQIPGNYVVSRSLTSAFRSVVSGENKARRALTIYNKDMNDEITRKRIEFGLE